MRESSLSLSLSLFFFLSLSLAIPQFGLLPQIVLRAFRPGPYPKQCSPHLPVQPPLLVGDVSVWATSLLGVVVRRIICGFYLFIFFLLVMSPSEIPKVPTDPLVRGFPGVWKLLLFYDSLPGTGLHP